MSDKKVKLSDFPIFSECNYKNFPYKEPSIGKDRKGNMVNASESLEDKAQRIRDFNMKIASGEFTEPTDLQKLKDVFDSIGVDHEETYYPHDKSTHILIDSHCMDCGNTIFEFIDGKYNKDYI